MTYLHHAKYRFSCCFTNYGKPFYCTKEYKIFTDVAFRTELELVDKMSAATILGQGSALRKLEGSPQQQQFISTTVYN